MSPAERRPLVTAHRGAAGEVVDGATAAENTIEAFTRAISLGADMIEFDVRRSRDGELIAFHDAVVGGVPVARLTRQEIAAATGVAPPLYAEVLEACAGRIGLDVELKEDGYVPEAMAALQAALAGAAGELERVVVTSFLPAVIAQAKRAFPEVKTGLLVGTDAPAYRLRTHRRHAFPLGIARKARADYLAPHYKLAAAGIFGRAAAAGLPCLVWTVNDEAVIRRLAADPRIAAIITDEPSKALAIVGDVAAGAPAALRVRPGPEAGDRRHRWPGGSLRYWLTSDCAAAAGWKRGTGKRRVQSAEGPFSAA